MKTLKGKREDTVQYASPKVHYTIKKNWDTGDVEIDVDKMYKIKLSTSDALMLAFNIRQLCK